MKFALRLVIITFVIIHSSNVPMPSHSVIMNSPEVKEINKRNYSNEINFVKKRFLVSS